MSARRVDFCVPCPLTGRVWASYRVIRHRPARRFCRGIPNADPKLLGRHRDLQFPVARHDLLIEAASGSWRLRKPTEPERSETDPEQLSHDPGV